MVGENQGSSGRSVGKCPVKPPRPEDDSQTIVYIPMQEPLVVFSIIDIFTGVEPAPQRQIASQRPNALPVELSGRPYRMPDKH